MLNFLPSPVIGVLAFTIAIINMLLWTSILFMVTLIKLVFRFNAARKILDPILTAIAANWISGNGFWMWLTQRTEWTVEGLDQLDPKGWYLVTSNHQSWVDIVVLQKLLNRRIPMLKFFLKKELARIPIMGQAWWALDFPFMSRHSKSYLKKYPEQAGKDLEATRRSCERFSLIPTSVMNFVEGTRITPEKHKRQKSPYKHLLKPKAGGMAFAVQTLGEKFHSLIDITIVYPDFTPTFWEFLAGKMHKVTVIIKERELPESFKTLNYSDNPEDRVAFQKWLGDIWLEKDQLIERRLSSKE